MESYTKKNWDAREREWVFDHGGRIDDNGIAHFPAIWFKDFQYTHESFRHPGKKALMISSEFGCSLIFEDLHFVID